MIWGILIILGSMFLLGFAVGMTFGYDICIHQEPNGITGDKLNELSEDERYLVIGIEDGWIHADRKSLSDYYEIYDRVMKG